MNILFLNQYAPPDLSPTSRLLGELAESCRTHGHQVAIVAQSVAYRGHHARSESRLVRELKALARIFFRGLAASPRPDVVLALSSPPCLLVAAAIISVARRCRLAHWAMDLYPDVALALGELEDGTLTRIFKRLMRWAYHRCRLIVALDDDMAMHLRQNYGVASRVLPPWPAAAISRSPEPGSAPRQDLASPGAELAAKQWTWLYSGNLGRAHEWRPLLLVQAELERRGLPIQLLFEGGGACFEAAQTFARELNLAHCRWTGYVTEEQSLATFRASRLICATQKDEARGLLWPSKLARIIPTTKPLLWVGPLEGAIARSLEQRPDTGCFRPEHESQMADWIENLYRSGSAAAEPNEEIMADRWRAIRERGCEVWDGWLRELSPGFVSGVDL